MIMGKNEVYMLDRDNTVFHIPDIEFPKRKDLNSNLINTLVDGVSIPLVQKLWEQGQKHSKVIFGQV